jgi:hypothetical protein
MAVRAMWTMSLVVERARLMQRRVPIADDAVAGRRTVVFLALPLDGR